MCGVNYVFLILFTVPFHFHLTKIGLPLWFLDALHTTDIVKAWISFFPNFHDLDLQCMFSIPCVGLCCILFFINQQDAAMSSQYLYFTAMSLYMFRVLPTLIIRSTKYCSTQPLVWVISSVGIVKGENH
jgi:hypothetical protein